MAVPCELATHQKHYLQTVVVKLGADINDRALIGWACSQLHSGFRAYAYIRKARTSSSTTSAAEECYLVVTLAKPWFYDKRFRTDFKKRVEESAASPKVELVEPLTRRLQRLFGWGDVCATKADIVKGTEGHRGG